MTHRQPTGLKKPVGMFEQLRVVDEGAEPGRASKMQYLAKEVASKFLVDIIWDDHHEKLMPRLKHSLAEISRYNEQSGTITA